MDPPACRIVGWILHDLCSKWYSSHSDNWNLLASDSISLRHRIWVFHSASLQVLIGRNLALEHPRLSPDDSRLHLFDWSAIQQLYSIFPCYIISSFSWLILDTVSAPLNLLIHQDGVSASSDWILIQDGVVRPYWRGLIRRPLAKEFPDVLMLSFFSALLPYPAHVLLASVPSLWSSFLSVLVTCTWTLRLFPSSTTRSSYRFSSFPINNLPYSLLSVLSSNLSSQSMFLLNAPFSYIWPILFPSP